MLRKSLTCESGDSALQYHPSVSVVKYLLHMRRTVGYANEMNQIKVFGFYTCNLYNQLWS